MSTRTDRPRHHWWQHRSGAGTAVLDREDAAARTDDPDLIDLRTPAERTVPDERPIPEARREDLTERDFATDPESRTYRRQQAAVAAAAPATPVEDHGAVVRDHV